MSGKARGRARGRARGNAAEGAQAAAVPGAGPPPAPQPSQAPPPGMAPKRSQEAPGMAAGEPQSAVPPSGRAQQRGGGGQSGGKPPGGNGGGGGGASGGAIADLTRKTQGMNMGPRARRRGDTIVQEPRTKPEHILDTRGTAGSEIRLLTNFFKLEMAPNYMLYQYHVEFVPDLQNQMIRKSLIREIAPQFPGIHMFDGMQLFIARRFPNKTTTFNVTRKTGEPCQINITLTNELPPNNPTTLQLYNLIFKQILRIVGFSQVGRHYFNPELKAVIDRHKLEVWPGYITSILQYDTSVMLMAEISHKVLRTDTVLDALYEIYQRSRGNVTVFHDEAKKNIIGQIVLTRYNNKTYRIDDILFDKNPGHTFENHRGEKISFVDYYRNTHEKQIKDMKQPILVHKPKYKEGQQLKKWQLQVIWLIPELCAMTGLTDQARANFTIMKDLAQYTRLGPEDRCRRVQNLLSSIKKNPDANKKLTDWGLKFSDNLLQIPGRVLPQEKVYMSGRELNYRATDADWGRSMRDISMNNARGMANWLFLYARSDRDGERNKDEFLQCLRRVAGPMGMKCNAPQIIPLDSDRTDQYTQAINRYVTPEVQMVVCLLPNNRKDRYDAIKKLCCVDRAVPSQCMLNKSLSKNAMSVVTKIAIQLSCKMGGDVWNVDMPLKNVMICGYDTYHDSGPKKEGKKQSVGAFLASYNKTCTQYTSRVAIHHAREELSNHINFSITACAKKFHQLNGVIPDRIIFYRDGVGDGQLDYVYDIEVKNLLKALESMPTKPKLTVIVVKKRVSTRFFSIDGNRLNNPPPGTKVDTEVTRPEWYDFFLIPQAVRQGTVTPTHFNIIHDESNLKPDHLQRLTYKLTHLYFNWPGTVRVPAPCQYAHKLAYLVGTSIHKSPDLKLSDNLFFL